MVVVAVKPRPSKGRLELELDQRQFLATGLDRRDPVVRPQRLALALPEEDGSRCRQATSGLGVEAVEATRFAAIKHPQVLREAAVRCVEVEEAGGGEAPESVHHAGWRRDGCTRSERVLLVVHEKRQLALEHVERISVLAVDVRRCAGVVLVRATSP